MTSVDSNGRAVSGDQDIVEYVPVEAEIARRLRPRQIGTGAMRGQQTILNADGTKIVLGLIPDTIDDYGITFLDTQGREALRITGTTLFMNDPEEGTNRLQIGELPDGTYDVAISDTGENVADAF